MSAALIDKAARQCEAEADRAKGYLRHGAQLLHQVFAPMLRALSCDQVSDLLLMSRARAIKCGAVTERLQLQYLVMVANWGCDFDTDPQYSRNLRAADWPNSLPAQPLRFAAVLARLAAAVERDEALFAHRAGLHDGLRDRAFQDVSHHDWGRADGLILCQGVHHLWPERFADLGCNRVSECCTAMVDRLRAFDLTPSEIGLLTIMSFQLGHGLCHDPRFPWLSKVIRTPQSPDRQDAMIAGLWQAYLDRQDCLTLGRIAATD
ncbi:hypothetical protein [Paracoccus sp. (in: a-proteobacteria)]|uniref:hypothetical protein n=1 Tax=Paracoccus sp. TaxID=267 RepID=UPI0028A2118F|nr:hypothetical protein [Paracoccus sp. (in: a-proteobacteria)]